MTEDVCYLAQSKKKTTCIRAFKKKLIILCHNHDPLCGPIQLWNVTIRQFPQSECIEVDKRGDMSRNSSVSMYL